MLKAELCFVTDDFVVLLSHLSSVSCQYADHCFKRSLLCSFIDFKVKYRL